MVASFPVIREEHKDHKEHEGIRIWGIARRVEVADPLLPFVFFVTFVYFVDQHRAALDLAALSHAFCVTRRFPRSRRRSSCRREAASARTSAAMDSSA